jgi:hypothetical protein
VSNHRRWIVVLLLLAGAGVWYRLSTDDVPTSTEAEDDFASPVIVAVKRAAIVEAPEAGSTVLPRLDASVIVSVVPDAGSREPSREAVEAYIARWRAVLAPLMRQHPPRLAIVKGDSFDGGLPRAAPVVDAGLPCVPGIASVSLTTSRSADVVVFIDTSGSMWDTLERVVRWLGTLQYRIDRDGVDAKLVVVADRQWGFRRAKLPLDASVLGQRIESWDILDILLRSGFASDGWRTLLRPSVPTELVLVTDDSSHPAQPFEAYERRVRELLGPAADRTRFHLLGGFGPEQRLLGPQDPVNEATCTPNGQSAGVVYQRLVNATGGARASLCSPEAMELLHEQLLTPPQPRFCTWTPMLPARALPEHLRVLREHGHREQLLLELPGGCANPGARRGYLQAGDQYILCPGTCDAIGPEKFLALELPYTCR